MRTIFNVIISVPLLLSPLTALAGIGDPNGADNEPKPGWSLWRPKTEAEIKKANFDSGFSNIELGGYLDFENLCETKAGLPKEKIKYWFRLSNTLERIGTGKVEYGCWVKGRFLATHESTAVKSGIGSVECLRVNSPVGNGLLVRSSAGLNSKQVGVVANGRTLKPTGFPASIVEVNNRVWVAIASPIEGWVSDGMISDRGNLMMCR